MRLYFDFEFTGLHQNTTPISLGVVAANGKCFYSEFTDYARDQVDDWIQKNVIDNLMFNEDGPFCEILGDYAYVKGTANDISNAFCHWLTKFDKVEFWGDCLSYDGVLLNELFGGGLNAPANVDYIFYDICTLFKVFDIDPDISREAFIDRPIDGAKHNSLYDSKVIQACYEKLMRNKDRY
ncbi:RNaseH [Bacillus phage Mater]|uniref:RNaseH n=1 Tax=Bacillus phage Mater TaxID=1540090 RepID=A0A0A0RS84_9CAUD|nr:Rnase H [Bacillus phage Mater]AIW03366.1 RNaseH [Bacillus phage Mater]